MFNVNSQIFCVQSNINIKIHATKGNRPLLLLLLFIIIIIIIDTLAVFQWKQYRQLKQV